MQQRPQGQCLKWNSATCRWFDVFGYLSRLIFVSQERSEAFEPSNKRTTFSVQHIHSIFVPCWKNLIEND